MKIEEVISLVEICYVFINLWQS